MPDYTCHECGRVFPTQSGYNQHMRIHTGETGERSFGCGICGASFGQYSSLIRHMRTHTGELPFVCPECRQRFARHSRLIQHVRTHFGERPFVCTECRQRFARRHLLRDHMPTCTVAGFDSTFDVSVTTNAFGVTVMTNTRRTEHLTGSTTTTSTLTSPLGAAVVTATQSPTSSLTTTVVSQPSGTFAFTDSGHKPGRDYGSECSICYEPFGSEETETIVTPCDHKFHKACLSELQRLSGGEIICPLCRCKLA